MKKVREKLSIRKKKTTWFCFDFFEWIFFNTFQHFWFSSFSLYCLTAMHFLWKNKTNKQNNISLRLPLLINMHNRIINIRSNSKGGDDKILSKKIIIWLKRRKKKDQDRMYLLKTGVNQHMSIPIRNVL